MKSEDKFTCPLCDSHTDIRYIGVSRMHVLCQQCTEFILCNDAETRLRSASQQTRNELSMQALATTDPEYTYEIRGNTPNESPHIDLQGAAKKRASAFSKAD